MFAAQLARGYIALKSGCYLKCLTCKSTINSKTSCKDHEPLINLFKKSFQDDLRQMVDPKSPADKKQMENLYSMC